MAIEIEPDVEKPGPAPAQPPLQALLRSLQGDAGQAVLEALTQGADMPGVIRAFVSKAPMDPESRSFVEMALAAHDHAPTTVEAEEAPAPVDDAELRDLRQVNDTLADALGACRICWGGDPACAACRGRGRAGSARPDPKLFEELVAPAVRRVLTMRREERGRFTRNGR